MATNKDDAVSKKERDDGSGIGLEAIKLWQVSVVMTYMCMYMYFNHVCACMLYTAVYFWDNFAMQYAYAALLFIYIWSACVWKVV